MKSLGLPVLQLRDNGEKRRSHPALSEAMSPDNQLNSL
jgi:hypothetical protein